MVGGNRAEEILITGPCYVRGSEIRASHLQCDRFFDRKQHPGGQKEAFYRGRGIEVSHHRYFDSRMGKYLNSDPIGQGGGMNLYTYVSTSPINRTDPLGLWYIDTNISGGYWLGFTGGILFSPSGVYPYVGGGVVTPGVGGSVTWSPSDPTLGGNPQKRLNLRNCQKIIPRRALKVDGP